MNGRRSTEEKRKFGYLFAKFKIQELIEKPIIKYGIDPDAFAYNIIISRPDLNTNDIFIRKKGDKIYFGFDYFTLSTSGDLLWDIVMTFEYNNGFWIPLEIENSFLEEEDYSEETFKEWIETFKPWLDKGEFKNGVYLGSNGENIHISEHTTK